MFRDIISRIFVYVILLGLVGCDPEFDPDLSGWKAYTHPARRVHVDMDGREKVISLPGGEGTGYRYPQWTKSQDHILLTQLISTHSCYDYRIISIDTTGTILDTLYTAPPRTPLNFKLAPNDSLLLIKSYVDNCTDVSSRFRYTFYNRYLHTWLPDTISVRKAKGIPLRETIWSPDSRRVIISEWSGQLVKAFAYDLVTRDSISIDKGSNFVWSPTDNNLVGYIKDHSIYTKDLGTGEEEMVYEGRSKKSAGDFRWSPGGDFLMIHVRSYLLNVEAPMFQSRKIIYLSLKDGRESRVHFDDQRIDTWKHPAQQ